MRVSNVGDHEARQASEHPDRLSERLCLWLVEVEDNWEVAALAEFLPQPLKDLNPALGEPP